MQLKLHGNRPGAFGPGLLSATTVGTIDGNGFIRMIRAVDRCCPGVLYNE